ncbi:MAG: hypothetical protein RL071_622 [Pseudomonadota bacterium]|jgi:hypothetical protein
MSATAALAPLVRLRAAGGALALLLALGVGAARAEPAAGRVVYPLPDAIVAQATGVSWREGCPVPLDQLALIELRHVDMQGAEKTGQLIIHKDEAAGVLSVFEALYAARFPIKQVRLIDHYGGDDDKSMADDNTSGFNCRGVGGSAKWSQHAYGLAIDLNTVENPYVRTRPDGSLKVAPPAGAAYLDRADLRPGMAVEGSVVVAAFEQIGWKWGGRWRSSKDYQHFSKTGG